jgi:hypothetical protein
VAESKKFLFSFLSDQPVEGSIVLDIDFYNAGKVLLNESSITKTFNNPVNGWTENIVDFTVPPNASYAVFTLSINETEGTRGVKGFGLFNN